MADGPLTYLNSNRETSRRLAKQVNKKLGSLGGTIIDNFESIESSTELAAAHAFVAEIVASQRSHTDRDLILKYADAFYAEFADKLIQAKGFLFNSILKLSNLFDIILSRGRVKRKIFFLISRKMRKF